MGRWLKWMGLSVGLLAALPGAAGSGRAVARAGAASGEPVAWRYLVGNAHRAEEAAGSRATVLVFGSTRCPCADGYTSRLRRLAEEYGARQVRFFLVFSTPGIPRAEIEQYTS